MTCLALSKTASLDQLKIELGSVFLA